MYRKAKRDNNEPRIRRFFERCGATVFPLDDPGIPDLLIGYQGHTLLCEVKDKTGSLTAKQQDFFKHWQGQAAVVRSYQDAKLVLRKLTMPVYTYKCESCQQKLSVVQSMFEEPLQTHDNCGGKLVRLIVSVPVIIYRGDGWAGKRPTP